MAIGERIKFYRKYRGLTMRKLGVAVGFPKDNADVRIAQYESGNRVPKNDMILRLAEVLDVEPSAIDIPDLDTDIGVMFSLFRVEDNYGLTPDCICNIEKNPLVGFITDWKNEYDKYKRGEISKKEYDDWRYSYIPDYESIAKEKELLAAMGKSYYVNPDEE